MSSPASCRHVSRTGSGCELLIFSSLTFIIFPSFLLVGDSESNIEDYLGEDV